MVNVKSGTRSNLDYSLVTLLIASYFYCLPLGRYTVLGFQTDYRIYDYMIFATMVALAPRMIPYLKVLYRRRILYFRPLLLLILLVWASMFFTFLFGGAKAFFPAIIRAYRFSAFLLTAGAIWFVIRNKWQWLLAFRFFYFLIAAEALIAFFQGIHLLPGFWPTYWQAAYRGGYPVATLSPHHKHIGVVMLMGTGLSLYLFQQASFWWWKSLYLFILALTLTVPIFSGSRTALLGLLGLLLGYAIGYRARGVYLWGVTAASFAFLFFAFKGYIRDPLEMRIQERLIIPIEKAGTAGLYEERTHIYFRDIPRGLMKAPWVLLTGTGFQNFATFFGATGAHNNYLHVWMELGIVGFFVYLAMLYRIHKNLRALWRHPDRPVRAMAKHIWAVFLGILFTMMVGESFWGQYSMFTLSGQIMTLIGFATWWLKPARSRLSFRRPSRAFRSL